MEDKKWGEDIKQTFLSSCVAISKKITKNGVIPIWIPKRSTMEKKTDARPKKKALLRASRIHERRIYAAKITENSSIFMGC